MMIPFGLEHPLPLTHILVSPVNSCPQRLHDSSTQSGTRSTLPHRQDRRMSRKIRQSKDQHGNVSRVSAESAEPFSAGPSALSVKRSSLADLPVPRSPPINVEGTVQLPTFTQNSNCLSEFARPVCRENVSRALSLVRCCALVPFFLVF